MVSGVVRDVSAGQPLPGANIFAVGTTSGTTSDAGGRFSLQIPPGATTLMISFIGFESIEVPIRARFVDVFLAEGGVGLEEVVVTAATPSEMDDYYSLSAPAADAIGVESVQYPTVIHYEVDERLTVPPDGKSRTVELRRVTMDAVFNHVVVPKRSLVTFLTASIPDWAGYDLEPSVAAMFVGNVFVGDTYLFTGVTSDTLTLPLGPDPGITVRREKTREFTRTRFLGSKRHVSLGFRISVRNNKTEVATVEVQDQVPISVNKQIEVDIGSTDGAAYDEETGFLEWTLEVPPGTTRTVEFDYTVKYPKGMNLVLE